MSFSDLLGPIGAAIGNTYGGGITGALIGAQIGGGIATNQTRRDIADSANQFSAEMYRNRYQMQVEDMKAAGLNPMLAYMQAPGPSPTGQQAQVSNPYEYLDRSYSSAFNVDVERKRIEADTNLKAAQAVAQESLSRLNDAQRDVALKTVDKVVEETANIKKDTERLDKLVLVLDQQRQNLVKQGWNLTEQGNVLRATVDKLKAEVPFLNSAQFRNTAQAALANAETRLKGFDINAAERSDNFGRSAAQYQFLLEIAKMILKR